jgi:hypothetical protein
MAAIPKNCPNCTTFACAPNERGIAGHHSSCPEVAHLRSLHGLVRNALSQSKFARSCYLMSESSVHLYGSFTATELESVAEALETWVRPPPAPTVEFDLDDKT